MVPGLPILGRAAPAVPGLDVDGALASARPACLALSGQRRPAQRRVRHYCTQQLAACLARLCRLAKRPAAQQPRRLRLPGVGPPHTAHKVPAQTADLWPQVWSVVLLLQAQALGVVTLGIYWSLLYAGTALVEQYL